MDAIRAFMEEQDPAGQLGRCGIREILIERSALESVATLARREVAAPPGTTPRCVLLVDNVLITRGGDDVKALVEAALREWFDVSRVVLDDGQPTLHAADEILDEAAARVEGADVVVAVGGGTICDIAKWGCSRASTRPKLVVVQTAASVDGFTDDVSVVLRNGVKRTVPTCWPDVVVADIDLVAEAPARLNRSGYGEMLSMLVAPADWLLAYRLGIDATYHTAPIALLRKAGEGLDEWSGGLAHADPRSVERLLQALAVRGITTGTSGSTAVLSGVEHLVSHMLDLYHGARHEPIGLHGEQVGVGSLVAAACWELLFARMAEGGAARLVANLPTADLHDWRGKADEAFGRLDTDGRIAAECWSDLSRKLTRWTEQRSAVLDALSRWNDLSEELRAQVVSVDQLARGLVGAGGVTWFDRLAPSVDDELTRWAVANCALMRDRFTVVDLLAFAGWWREDDVAQVLARARSAVGRARAAGRCDDKEEG